MPMLNTDPTPLTDSTVETEDEILLETEEELEDEVTEYPSGKRGWSLSLFSFILVCLFGGVGFVATAWLLKLPSAPNCPKASWSFTSASMRLYCAQLEADDDTPRGLLNAIELVESIPTDHPLRPSVDRYLQEWSEQLLELAEEQFQKGKLREAIDIANLIPKQPTIAKKITEKISRWQTIWKDAETIYSNAEKEMRKGNWQEAFRWGVRLTYVENHYWTSAKYDQLVDAIQQAQEEKNRLQNVRDNLKKESIDSLIQVLTEAKSITPKSYAYEEAQDLMIQAQDKLEEKMYGLITRGQWSLLESTLRKIPSNAGLSEEISDWEVMINAGKQTSSGKIEDYQTAMEEVETLDSKRPLFDDAQKLLSYWQQEIDALVYLGEARTLAESGTLDDLQSAISRADLVPEDNPRYQEAQNLIQRWRNQTSILEDQPLLAEAKSLAQSGDIGDLQRSIDILDNITPNSPLYSESQRLKRQWRQTIKRSQDQPLLDYALQKAGEGTISALQEAIAVARRIDSDSPLYQEAQSLIQESRNRIETEQDQPILSEAIALAENGNYAAAIRTAQSIKKNRALYQQSRSKIAEWQQEIRGQELYAQAERTSYLGTTTALISAIKLIHQIPQGTSIRYQSNEAMNRWAYQLLAIAQDTANTSIPEAIRIARLIPSYTTAYNSATVQIQAWQQMISY